MALIETSVRDGIATVTLNRPERRNASTPELNQQLVDHMRAFERDDGVTVIILTGAGSDFCVGGDREVVSRMIGDENFHSTLWTAHMELASALLDLATPTIAAVHGRAMGFGAELAAFCDLLVMSEEATLCDPHVRYGLPPAPGALLLWPQLVSRKFAAELLLTGREVSAREAVQLGLANRAVPEGQHLAEAEALARQITANPREGVMLARRSLRQSYAALLDALPKSARMALPDEDVEAQPLPR